MSEPLNENEKQNIEPPQKIIPIFNNDSELIVNSFMEKLISLVITTSDRNTIDRIIPDFCFSDMQKTLEIMTQIELITYDKDDLQATSHLFDANLKSDHEKSSLIKNQDSSFFIADSFKMKDESEFLKSYEFEKNLDPQGSDPCSINLDVFIDKKEIKKKIENDKNKKPEKIVLGILTKKPTTKTKNLIDKETPNNKNNNNKNNNIDNNKKSIKNKNEPFVLSPNENIDNIEKAESHRLDCDLNANFIFQKYKKQNLLYDTVIDKKNNWEVVSHPSPAPIDRDAGTKIKFFPIKHTNKMEKNPILEESQKIENTSVISPISRVGTNINAATIKSESNKPLGLKKKIKNPFTNNKSDQPKKNKKKVMMIELSSYDIDPNKLGKEIETEELMKLREDLNKELEIKRIEQAKKAKKEQERLLLEQERLERQKELANKNITVDINGNLVFIKPIDANSLVNEFFKSKSNTKEKEVIESESNQIIRKKEKKKTIKVEKNPDALIDPETDKNHNKKKGKYSKFGYNSPMFRQGMRTSEPSSPKKEPYTTKISSAINYEKTKGVNYSAGSNFNIINLECGVNLKEESKTKTGGRDFFEKFGRYSVKVFEEQLSKTVTSNFYPGSQNMNLTNLQKKTNREVSEKKISKPILEETESNIVNVLPSEANNRLSLRTSNLKMALQHLDLITEGEENRLKTLNNKTKDIIKENKNLNIDNTENKKKDYGEMNIFAKTLMGKDWGTFTEQTKKVKRQYKIPSKPESIELKRELPNTILNHMPRKRLPPITVINRLKEQNMGKTASMGFFNKAKMMKKTGLTTLTTEEDKEKEKNTKNNNNDEKKNKNKKDKKHFKMTSSGFYSNTMS